MQNIKAEIYFETGACRKLEQWRIHTMDQLGNNSDARVGGASLIIGLGKTGLSCARFLKSRGVEFSIIDSREKPPGLEVLKKEMPEVPFISGVFDADIFREFGQLIVSPGVSIREPSIAGAIKNNISVLGDIQLFSRYAGSPVIAITGSNGKSTVTDLLGKMIHACGKRAAVGGNFGVPALDLLSRSTPDYFVLELSSFQLETTHSLNAAASVILNVSPDHMDRYIGLEDYIKAKQKIYRGDGIVVINDDDELLGGCHPASREYIRFGVRNPKNCDFTVDKQDGKKYLAHHNATILAVDEIKLSAPHDLLNALAALSLGHAIGLPVNDMAEVLKWYSGLPHRMQLVASFNGVRWINDSKGTNVGASMVAMTSIETPIVWIAGGESKDADFSQMAMLCAKKCRVVILMGRDQEKLGSVFSQHVSVEYADSMSQAVELANDLAYEGDTVLLSPACASQDMFLDYQQRGDCFSGCVKRLVKNK